MFDDSLLEEFIQTFYGYGNYSGPYWFIGMEEGGGNSVEAVIARIKNWKDRGGNELEDLMERNSSGGGSKFFRERPVAQTTWKQLIRIMLVSRGNQASLSEIKLYQRDHLGRRNNDTCLVELLPLPSPSTNNWLYGPYTSLPQLKGRDIYREHYAHVRAHHLKTRVTQHRPALVVFYGSNWWYKQYWQTITEVKFHPVETGHGRFLLGNNIHTRFAIVQHPASRGISNAYFHAVGTHIALNT
jgi:hypothetical protein